MCYFLFSFFFAAPVVGNFTDEEFMGASGSQDNSEYPFQRDEVARIPYNKDRNTYDNPGKDGYGNVQRLFVECIG